MDDDERGQRGPYLLSARARDAAGNQTTPAGVSGDGGECGDPGGGLVAAYGFNEGTGTTLPDRTGNGAHGDA